MWLGGKFRDVKPTIPALLVAGLCFTVPYFLIAHFVGPELPSIIGGIVGLGIFIAILRTGVFTPEKIWQLEQKERNIEEERKYSLLHSAVPYLIVTGAILCTRLIEPVSAFCQSQVSVPWHEMFGTQLGFTEKFLWNPGFIFIAVSLLCTAIFRMPGAQVQKAWSLAAKRLAPAAVSLLFAVAMSQVMINSDHNLSGMNAMLIMLALAVALVVGRAFPILAPFIGVLGAYIAGSNTVSNILFSGFQYATAKALGISRTITVALQAVGGAAGIMISVHSVVAACAVVGIAGQEGSVIKKTLIPCIIYGAVAGIIGMIVILIVGKGIF